MSHLLKTPTRRVLRSAGLALLAVLSGCVADEPNIAELPASDGGPAGEVGAGAPDASAHDGAAGTACRDDRFGPSTPDLPAARLGRGRHDLVACPGAPDHLVLVGEAGSAWRLRYEASAKVVVQVGDTQLTGRAGSLRVELGNQGMALSVSAGPEPADYWLDLSPDLEDGRCQDGLEADDEFASAGALTAEVPVTRGLCSDDDVDWLAFDGPGVWRIELLEGPPIWLDLLGDQPLGRVRYAGGSTRGEGPIALSASGPARLRVSGTGPAIYRVVVAATAPSSWSAAPTRVQVPYRANPRADVEWWPASNLQVLAQGAEGTSRVVRLDGQGAAALDAGQALAIEAQAWANDYRITVGPDADDDRPWLVPLVPGEDGTLRPDPEAPNVAALAVAVAAADALAAGLAWVPAPFDDPPPLHISWRPSSARACGSCFHPSAIGRPRVDLSGRPSDPDEGDLAVIRHEVGHYLAAVHSRDTSPGGRHDGAAVDPELAWSEGFAHFFAGWVGGTPVLTDWRLTGTRRVNLEAPEHPDAQVPWGPPYGPVSDHLIAALLWDLHDDTPGEDGVMLDDGALFAPIFGPMASGVTGGATNGAELLDYLFELTCSPGGPPTAEWSDWVELDEPVACDP